MNLVPRFTLRFLLASALIIFSATVLCCHLLDGGMTIAQIKRSVLIMAIISVCLVTVIGYLITRSISKRLMTVVEKIRLIDAESTHEQRLEISHRRDEIDLMSEEFNGLIDDLDQAIKSQKMFVSNVSHELRTPLAALVAEVEVTLLKERDAERYRQSLENIHTDTGRIISLVNGLLNLAKADYNPSQIKMENVRLDELLMDARKTVITAHPDYQIDVVFDDEAEDDSMITVNGNVYLLTMAFVNLMENNCKFSQNKSSIVTIGFYSTLAVVSFSDCGIGISPEDKQKVFEPFYRGENQYYTGGHGIGMALVYKIVRLHGGVIDINTQKGEGTSFILRLKHI